MESLAQTLAFAIGINLLMFIPAYIWQTDLLTDASYAITFAALAFYSYLQGPGGASQLVLLLMILAWALRLGAFLFLRAKRNGGRDSRFDEMRTSVWKFGRFWLLQGISAWIILLPSSMYMFAASPSYDTLFMAGFLVWVIGLSLETIADFQKYRFNTDPKNKGRWISTGLWSWSRHPNYFGEMTVWAGIYLLAFPALSSSQRLIGLIGPVFIILLLRYGSGVPILEKLGQERWGKDESYKRYIEKTNLLIPAPPKS